MPRCHRAKTLIEGLDTADEIEDILVRTYATPEMAQQVMIQPLLSRKSPKSETDMTRILENATFFQTALNKLIKLDLTEYITNDVVSRMESAILPHGSLMSQHYELNRLNYIDSTATAASASSKKLGKAAERVRKSCATGQTGKAL